LLLGDATRAQIDVQRCEALLQSLDELYNAGRAEPYLARFAAEQPMLHALHARQVRTRFDRARSADKDIIRHTRLRLTPRLIGQNTLMAVSYRTSWSDGVGTPLSEHGFLVAREYDGEMVPVIAIEAPATADVAVGAVVCPPCNYEVGPAAGWLCVPISRPRSNAMEAATFLLLGTDVAVEVSVQVAATEQPAARVIDRVVGQLLQHVPDASRPMTEPWLPSSLGDRRPAGFSGARVVVDLPDGQRTVVYGSVLGTLHHLLLLRGARTAQRRHRPAIQRLLQSYRLVATDQQLAEQAARSLSHHAGGSLTESGGFVSSQHDLVADAPSGWQPALRCAGCVFQVRWDCPRGTGRVWLSAHRPPAGNAHWSPVLADHWLEQFVDRLRQSDPGASIEATPDSGWSAADDTGERLRELVLTGGAAPGATAQRRQLRLLLRQDLFIVADGYVRRGQDPAAMLAALDSVRRGPP